MGLPILIHFNQNGVSQGRTIFDAVRAIGDVIEYAKYKDIPRILVVLTLKKLSTLSILFFF